MKTKSLLLFSIFFVPLEYPGFSHWHNHQIGTTVNLSDVLLLDNSDAIAIGYSGTIPKNYF